MIKLENYYFFGLPIPLEHYGLGCLVQPRIRDFIISNTEIDEIIKPFLMGKIVSINAKDMVDKLDELTIMLLSSVHNGSFDELIDSIKKSLCFIYQADNVEFNSKNVEFIVNESIIVNKNNFKVLSTILFEMFLITLNEDNLKKKKEEDDIIDEFERRRLEYEAKTKNKKKNDLSFLDIVNIVVHSQDKIDYESALNMTVFQMKNSYVVLQKKESSRIELMRQASMKFDVKEVEHWQTISNIEESKMKLN